MWGHGIDVPVPPALLCDGLIPDIVYVRFLCCCMLFSLGWLGPSITGLLTLGSICLNPTTAAK
jgi:hypothetical protein